MAPVRPLTTWLLVVALAAPGCALGVNGPDPDRPRDEVPQCDTGKGLVALDGVFATLAGVGSLAAFSDDESGTGVALLATGALFAASAYRGNRNANECRQAFDQYALGSRQLPRQVADRPAPRPHVRKNPETRAVIPVVPAPQDIRVPEPEPAPAEPVPDEALADKPPPAPPYQTPRPKPTKKPAKPADEDDWGWFWKEGP